jgi:hypothetical protein
MPGNENSPTLKIIKAGFVAGVNFYFGIAIPERDINGSAVYPGYGWKASPAEYTFKTIKIHDSPHSMLRKSYLLFIQKIFSKFPKLHQNN